MLYFLKFHEAFVLKMDLLASIEYLKEFVTRLDEVESISFLIFALNRRVLLVRRRIAWIDWKSSMDRDYL